MIPTKFPFKSTSAPPEFPGFTGAWCCIKASICKLFLSLSIPIFLALALTIPAVTVDLNSNGDPTARTHSPISKSSESPNLTVDRFSASILRTAISVVGSVPSISALNVLLSLSKTSISLASSTTWLLVNIYPSLVIITPDPDPLLLGASLSLYSYLSPKKSRNISSNGFLLIEEVLPSYVVLI